MPPIGAPTPGSFPELAGRGLPEVRYPLNALSVRRRDRNGFRREGAANHRDDPRSAWPCAPRNDQCRSECALIGRSRATDQVVGFVSDGLSPVHDGGERCRGREDGANWKHLSPLKMSRIAGFVCGSSSPSNSAFLPDQRSEQRIGCARAKNPLSSLRGSRITGAQLAQKRRREPLPQAKRGGTCPRLV